MRALMVFESLWSNTGKVARVIDAKLSISADAEVGESHATLYEPARRVWESFNEIELPATGFCGVRYGCPLPSSENRHATVWTKDLLAHPDTSL